MKREIYYNKDFWKTNRWASCFECDMTFDDLEKLFDHQDIHIKEETKRMKIMLS